MIYEEILTPPEEPKNDGGCGCGDEECKEDEKDEGGEEETKEE